jgi:hypothetical protein
MKSKSFKYLTGIIVLVFLIACKKKKQQPEPYPVPNVPVSVLIYPNDATNFKIQAVGGWMYVNGAGYQGLIIYRKTLEEFVAVERASPENPNSAASAVKVQSDNFTLRDTVKNARWQIVDGAVMNSSSKWPLRLYATSFDGNTLRVFN